VFKRSVSRSAANRLCQEGADVERLVRQMMSYYRYGIMLITAVTTQPAKSSKHYLADPGNVRDRQGSFNQLNKIKLADVEPASLWWIQYMTRHTMLLAHRSSPIRGIV